MTASLSSDDSVLADTLLKLLPYIRKMTVQERKVGTLLQANFRMNNLLLGIDLPLLLVERNFWLTKKEQEEMLEIA